jgi:hypothetical protein
MFSKKKKGTVFLRGAKTQGGNSGTVFYFNCFQLADLQRKIVTGKKRPEADTGPTRELTWNGNRKLG